MALIYRYKDKIYLYKNVDINFESINDASGTITDFTSPIPGIVLESSSCVFHKNGKYKCQKNGTQYEYLIIYNVSACDVTIHVPTNIQTVILPHKGLLIINKQATDSITIGGDNAVLITDAYLSTVNDVIKYIIHRDADNPHLYPTLYINKKPYSVYDTLECLPPKLGINCEIINVLMQTDIDCKKLFKALGREITRRNWDKGNIKIEGLLDCKSEVLMKNIVVRLASRIEKDEVKYKNINKIIEDFKTVCHVGICKLRKECRDSFVGILSQSLNAQSYVETDRMIRFTSPTNDPAADHTPPGTVNETTLQPTDTDICSLTTVSTMPNNGINDSSTNSSTPEEGDILYNSTLPRQ